MSHETEVLRRVDHLVYAARDLPASIDELERVLGVRAAIGGTHPGKGTRNALIALGPSCYLELIGPDPGQSPPAKRWLGVDDITQPRLTTWAVKATRLGDRVEHARMRGVDLGPVREGRRRGTNGVELTWQLTEAPALIANGIVPFLIDWGDSVHPAASAPAGCSLLRLRAEHPEPTSARAMLGVLGVELEVAQATSAALIATIRTPHGELELR